MSEIYFIRHGQASALSEDYDQLSNLGESQSYQTGVHLADCLQECHRIYFSSLKRHVQTFEQFKKGWESNGKSLNAKEVIMAELEEHHGYRAVKEIIPRLIAENKEIQQLASEPYETREEQIKIYFHIYAKISMMWAKGELNGLSDEHESWEDFLDRSELAFDKIKEQSKATEKIVVITSGGPIAYSMSRVLDLSALKTMEITWNIHNCSITKYLYNRERFSLSQFNLTHHLEKEGMVTLV